MGEICQDLFRKKLQKMIDFRKASFGKLAVTFSKD
jgi:hypothetical protein